MGCSEGGNFLNVEDAPPLKTVRNSKTLKFGYRDLTLVTFSLDIPLTLTTTLTLTLTTTPLDIPQPDPNPNDDPSYKKLCKTRKHVSYYNRKRENA